MKLSKQNLLDLFPSHRGELACIRSVSQVFTDSRKPAADGLFVPIAGERFDGHDFILSAIEQGACAALWQVDHPVPDGMPQAFPLFFVEDTVTGLQHMAQYALKMTDCTVIGITGSNGKTTTKDIMACVLKQTFHIHKTAGNFNNQLGLPLTILAMPAHCEVLILEMGMNHLGEISALSKLAQPDFGIITNIGESHIEYLGSREGIARAKMEMVDGLKSDGQMIYDGDEPLLAELGKQSSISCGYNDHNDVVITSVQESTQGIYFTLNQDRIGFDMPLAGRHNIKNAAFAISVARKLGVDTTDIAAALRALEVTSMRFQQLQGAGGSLFINDAYNASPTSMKAAIDTIQGFSGYARKVLVLGDMFELGAQAESYHKQVGEHIRPPITDMIAIGERARWIADTVKQPVHVHWYADKETALPQIRTLLGANTLVLFKASRAAELETLIEQLK